MSSIATFFLATTLAFPSDAAAPLPDSLDQATELMVDDSMPDIESMFTYQRGRVELQNGVATLNIPPGFKFLDRDQSRTVVVDIWGNPSAESVLGIILPENDGVLTEDSYAFVVQYDEIGYVKDDDADDIDYDDLLKELREGETEENAQRVEAGYDPVYLLGWAEKPYYDKQHKVLHWAKELKFGDSTDVNTLNYNIRVLGRKGVLILNAVAGMPQLPLVKEHLKDVTDIVAFNDGYRYDQFDSKVDDVAAWTIGGLVAGKVLAKAGILALLLKNIKLVLLAIAGLGGLIWRTITGRKKKQEQEQLPPTGGTDQPA